MLFMNVWQPWLPTPEQASQNAGIDGGCAPQAPPVTKELLAVAAGGGRVIRLCECGHW